MTAKDFPISTPFGQVDGYPLNNGFHTGIDYGCPEGTPVEVSGVVIGLSGNTGYSTVAHLHVGKWVGGSPLSPDGAFTITGVVHSTGYDDRNGNWVRIASGGVLWVYLHLSKILVQAGQLIEPQGGTIVDKEASYDFVANASQFVLLRSQPMTLDEYEKYHKGSTEREVYERFAASDEGKVGRYRSWNHNVLAQKNVDLANENEALKLQLAEAASITTPTPTDPTASVDVTLKDVLLANIQKLLSWLSTWKKH